MFGFWAFLEDELHDAWNITFGDATHTAIGEFNDISVFGSNELTFKVNRAKFIQDDADLQLWGVLQDPIDKGCFARAKKASDEGDGNHMGSIGYTRIGWDAETHVE